MKFLSVASKSTLVSVLCSATCSAEPVPHCLNLLSMLFLHSIVSLYLLIKEDSLTYHADNTTSPFSNEMVDC